MHNNDDVLDDLLNNGDEEDFDAELKIAVKNDRLRKLKFVKFNTVIDSIIASNFKSRKRVQKIQNF